MSVVLARQTVYPAPQMQRPAPGIVFPGEAAPGGGHELASRRFCAGILSALRMGESAGDAARTDYHVPRDTLLLHAAAALGIVSPQQLFGGVVPHAFLATKVIGHPLVEADAQAPAGWSHRLAQRMQGCVLPGYSVFGRDDLREAYRRLRGHGPVRIKCAGARGGHGQACIGDETALERWMQDLRPQDFEDGLAVEPHLEEVVTFSIGAVEAAGQSIAYSGIQFNTTDGCGRQVYGGSRLQVRRGTLEALLEDNATEPGMRQAIAHALQYERAVREEFPGFFASRRNYDIIQGVDGRGQWHCGVLEQSWRLGGASPAEVLAMRAFADDVALRQVEAATGEVYGEDAEIPDDAVIHFRGGLGSAGILTKFATVRPHGNPA